MITENFLSGAAIVAFAAIVLPQPAHADTFWSGLITEPVDLTSISTEELGVVTFLDTCLAGSQVGEIIALADEREWPELSRPSLEELPWGVVGQSIKGWVIDLQHRNVALMLQSGGAISPEVLNDFLQSRKLSYRASISEEIPIDQFGAVGRIECSVHLVTENPQLVSGPVSV